MVESRILINGNVIPDAIDNITLTSVFNANGNICVGEALAKSLEFSVYKPTLDFTDKELVLQLKNGNEWVNKGKYKVSSIDKVGKKVSILCYNAMVYKLQVPFVIPDTITLPTTSNVILSEIISQTGITIKDFDSLPIVTIKSISNDTCRNIIRDIACLMCKNAIINDDDMLEFKWYTQTSKTITDEEIYLDGISIGNETNVQIDYVECIINDNEALISGSGDYGIQITNASMTQEILDSILETLQSIQYKTLSVDFFGGYDIKIGDIIIINSMGNTYTMPVMELEHFIDGGMRSKANCTAYTKVENTSNNNSAAIVKERKEAERYARFEVSSDKINFLVSGDKKSGFEITEDAIKLISENIDLEGNVTFTSLEKKVDNLSVGGRNYLQGSKSMLDYVVAEYITDGTNRFTDGINQFYI